MTALESAGSLGGDPVTGNLRPHCRARGACRAKTPGKHCSPCQAASPETRARKSAAVRAALAADPEMLARKQACARRVAADPAVTARKRESMMRTHALPEVKARHRAGCRAGQARRLADPAKRAVLVQAGREFGAKNLVHAHTPEAHAKATASLRAANLAWCPPDYWDLNRLLKRRGHRLPERQRIIARKIEEAKLAHHDHRLAADYLRRFSAVYRCGPDGRIDPVGTHWRYGTRVLERIDVVKLAVAKGFAAQTAAQP